MSIILPVDRCLRPLFGRRRLAALFLALSTITLPVAPLHAHGDEARLILDEAPVGAYALSLWMSPAELRPGEMHVSAAVAANGVAVADCRVLVTATPLDRDHAPVTVAANAATAATGYRHEALLTLPEDGRYQVTVAVRDPQGSGGRQQFHIFVRPVSTWVNLLIFIQLALVPPIGLWLAIEGVSLWRRIMRGE